VPSRARDWLRQALRDLEHAEAALKYGHYEWACFAAQQATEKAVKALYQALHIEVWGNSISRMLEQLPPEHRPAKDLVDKARGLDRHYIPTRYPNFHPEGAPLDYYTEEDAQSSMHERSWSTVYDK